MTLRLPHARVAVGGFDEVVTHEGYRRGEPGFRRVSLALFAAGLATFSLLYAVQALLPALSEEFHVSPAASGLTVSLGTGALALLVVPISTLSERYGRTRVMTISVVAAALIGLALAVCTSFSVLLGLRAVQGIALAGLPAVAMAYLAEEVHPDSFGQAIGLYVAGNAVGGLSGRLLAGFVAGLVNWRAALVAVGVSAVACVLVYRVALPRASNFRPAPLRFGPLVGGLREHLADRQMRRLFLLGMLLMGQFVTVYNYLSYRLLAAPFHLPQTLVGLIFLVYLTGIYAAAAGGRLADRIGRRPTLIGAVAVAAVGALLTLPNVLPLIGIGLIALTVGFFAAHATASGWVSAQARTGRAQAAALYLCAYYAGSAVIGWFGGVLYAWAGWPGTGGFVLALLVVSLGVGLTLRSPAASGAVRSDPGVEFHPASP
ncbi:MAG TPA: MFS transporter [Mycobacteriales bacterium]